MQRINQVHFAENVVSVVYLFAVVQGNKEQLAQKSTLPNKRYQKRL